MAKTTWHNQICNIQFNGEIMAKPILVVKTKYRLSQAEYEDTVYKISKQIENEYHVLIVHGNNETTDVEVLNVNDVKETDIEELRKIVIDSIK